MILGVLILLAVIFAVLLGVAAVAVRSWERRRPDPAWRGQTPVQKFSGYDQDKGLMARRRALELEKSKRRLAARRSAAAPAPERDPRDSDQTKVVRLENARRTRERA
jgi:hypothetical protein